MFSKSKSGDDKSHTSDSIMKMPYPSPHTAEQAVNSTDKSSSEYDPNESSENPTNLFDDSNNEDKKWLKAARTYLIKDKYT